MPEQSHLTDEVFGLRRDVPLNYVARPEVDERFVLELASEKHVVIYGSSKQGKTCLRKECLQEEDCITVQCSNTWNLRALHTGILKEAGFMVTESVEKSASGSKKVRASFMGRIPGLGGGVETERSDEEGGKTKKVSLELEAEDVNDVIQALESIEFERFIVLEDFHYLPLDTQTDFSVALKAFHEKSNFSFIVVGVWLEENRLIVYNGDLTGRVVSVNADVWSDDELREVIDRGGALLGVSFSDEFKETLLGRAESNVYIVQEVCRLTCHKEGVTKTQDELRTLGAETNVEDLVTAVVDQQRGRYNQFLVHFATGFQDTELEMYKWLLYPVLTLSLDELRAGLSYRQVRERIQSAHPRRADLNPGNITQALQNVAGLQVKKKITPIILDYDQTNLRLNVVDRGFLIWLSRQGLTELRGLVGLPEPG